MSWEWGTTHYEGCGDAHLNDPRHASCPRKVWPGSWEGKRNRIRCKHCNDVIESTHQHDFKSCKCKMVSIDGGAMGHWRRLFPAAPASDHYEEMP